MNSNTVADNQDAEASQYNNLRKDVLEKGGDYADSTGSANAYALTVDAQIDAYVAGQTFKFKANFSNTGPATLDVNGLGAKAIKKNLDKDLAANDIKSGQIVSIIYDGTNMQLVSVLGNRYSIIQSLNAGETINGGTLPVAVYQSSADSEIYACDGNDTAKLNFLGFAVSNSTDGNSISVQLEGIVSGFSGLTVGSYYYVQDDKTLGTVLGTYYIPVGIAISTSEILIDKKILNYYLIASDVLQASSDTQESDNNDDYSKSKEIISSFSGSIRIKFDLATSNINYNAYGQIYINDLAVGTIRNTTSSSFVNFSEDFSIVAGDKIQLYTRTQNAGSTWIARNFRIYATKIASNGFLVTS